MPVARAGADAGLYWSLVAGLIVVDQITKALLRSRGAAVRHASDHHGLLDFVHVRNEGVAFGLLNTLDLPNKWVLTTALAWRRWPASPTTRGTSGRTRGSRGSACR